MKRNRVRNRKIPQEIKDLRPDSRIFALVRRGRNPIWKECFPDGEPAEMPKFRPNTVRKLCETMQDTLIPAEFAAQSMGFTLTEFQEWMKKGLEDMENSLKTPEAYLAYHVGRTQSKVLSMVFRNMFEAGAGTWQKWAWVAERSYAHFKNHPPPAKVKMPEKGPMDTLAEMWMQRELGDPLGKPLELPKLKTKEDSEK